MTCPKCRNIISNDSGYCLFCGNVLMRKGKTAVHYTAGAKKSRRTGAAKAQRFFLIAALLFGAVTFGVILLSPEIPWYASRNSQTPQLAQTPEPTPTATPEPTPTATPEPTPTVTPGPTPTATPEPTPTVTPEPTPTATPEAEAVSPTPETSDDPTPTPSPNTDGAFYGRSGEYPVEMFISVVESDDPDTQSSAEALMDERFSGTVTLDIDANGDGSMTIEQAFFSDNYITVHAFTDNDGTISTDMLYGLMYGDGYMLSVVCVFSGDSISGFFWMDDELTHIEFQYFG